MIRRASWEAAGTGSGAAQAPRAVQAGDPPCATAALSASIPAARDAASGHYGYPVNLSNHSGSSCTLDGYPGVSFISSPGGSQIGTAATRATTAYIFSAQSPQAVTLAPGHTAHADLQLISAGVFASARCDPQNVNWVRIYPPNQSVPLYASLTAQTCSKEHDMLTVSPVQSAGASNP